jgi:hypothetical protein
MFVGVVPLQKVKFILQRMAEGNVRQVVEKCAEAS